MGSKGNSSYSSGRGSAFSELVGMFRKYSGNDNGDNSFGKFAVRFWTIVFLIMWVIVGGFVYHFALAPRYNVWEQEMLGKAEFAKAEQNRKIKVEEAKANLEAEKLNAQAEVERAKGAADAIQIENGTITPQYIQYLWVRQQNNLNSNTVIYIPTKGNMPLFDDVPKEVEKLLIKKEASHE